MRSSDRQGSRAVISFKGSAISWIGPVGPTRGKARVYINGRLAANVNTYAARFKPTQVLFTKTFSTIKVRTLTVVVAGTRGHSTVAIDAFVVRGRARNAGQGLLAQPVPTSTGIPVPASIDATGGSDASAALQSWLGTVPAGSTIVFKAGGTYRMDKGLKVGRADLVFDGNGATLRSNGDASSASSLFIVSGTNIKIRNFKLVGNSPSPGSLRLGQEYAHGIQTYGATNVEISGVTISAVYGDGLMVGGWSDTVWFHDSRVLSAGRNGVAILAGRNVTVERVAFDTSGWATFDIEPWEASGGALDVTFRNNTAGTWNGQWGFFFGAEGSDGSVIRNVTVSGNIITGSPLTTYVRTARRQNIVFTNNTSRVAASGPILRFANIDGLTVTGNVQPLSSGALASINTSTDVTYTP